MSQAVVDAITGRFGDAVLETSNFRGDDCVVLDRRVLRDVGRFLKDDPHMAFDMPIDVTAVDYLEYPDHTGPRFAVFYHLYSTSKKHRIRLKVRLEADDVTLPSLKPVWRGVDWFERETYDMFGVVFDGHGDLRRILLYPEFQGHPLRKDYPLRGYQPRVPIASLPGDEEDRKMERIELNPDPRDLLGER